MVKENTHLYIADIVFRRLRSDRLAAPLYTHQAEYYLGAIIPDSFMYLREVEKVAARLHGTNGEKTNELIFRMLSHLKRHRDDERDRALLYGYLTHCAADITFHPMVWYLAGKCGAIGRHRRIETYLDTLTDHSVSLDRSQVKYHPKGLDFPRLLSRHLRLERPYTMTGRALRRQRLADVLYRTHGVYYIVKALSFLQSVRDLPGLFYADVKPGMLPERISYRHPVTGSERDVSVHELLEESVRLSLRMIACAQAFFENKITRRQAERILTGQSLETGLVGVGVQRMRYFALP
jgi:hypothetical protein